MDMRPRSLTQRRRVLETRRGQPAPSSRPVCGRFGEVSTGELELLGGGGAPGRLEANSGPVSPVSPTPHAASNPPVPPHCALSRRQDKGGMLPQLPAT